MEHATHRPMLALATLTTVGALALSPITVAPTDAHMPSFPPALISTDAVQLTNAWTDLVTVTSASLTQLRGMFLGTDTSYPLPNPTLPLAPVATQLVLNQLIYVAQLFTGQAGQIPGEIGDHLNKAGLVFYQIAVAGGTSHPPATAGAVLCRQHGDRVRPPQQRQTGCIA